MSWFSSISYYSKLKMYEEAHPPSRVTGESKCNRCGSCCWTRPPRLTQTDLEKVSSFLEMSPSDFFKTYCVVDDPAGTLAPVLIREHQSHLAGEYLPSDETFSIEQPCAFLGQTTNSCRLQNAKPQECALHECWSKDTEKPSKFEWTKNELMLLGWDGVDWDDRTDLDEYEDD